MKTNYLSHNAGYIWKKKNGDIGWSNEKTYHEEFKKIKLVIEYLTFEKDAKILDLGCGAGNIAIWFFERGYTNVYGIDIAKDAIEWAKEKAENLNAKINFKTGSGVSLDIYENDSFDFICDSAFLHCIIGEDRSKALNNIFRILKIGGTFMIKTMCQPFDAQKLSNDDIKMSYDNKTKCLLRNNIATRYIGNKEDILKEATNVGFKIIKEFETEDVGGDLVAILRKI